MSEENARKVIKRLEKNPHLLVVRMWFMNTDFDGVATFLMTRLSNDNGRAIVALEFEPSTDLRPRLKIYWPDEVSRLELVRWLDSRVGYKAWSEGLVEVTGPDLQELGGGSPRVLQQLMQIRGALIASPAQVDPNGQLAVDRLVHVIEGFVQQKNKEAAEFGIRA